MHVRCSHCQNPIELVGASQLNDATCPSCGNHFTLADDEKVGFDMPYWVGFADFEKTGPLVCELCKGPRSFCSKMAL